MTITPNDPTAKAMEKARAKDALDANTAAYAKVDNIFSDVDLRGITDLSSALALLESKGVTAESIESFGDGFSVLDKETLVGKAFLILGWKFTESKEFGGYFVVVHVITETEKGILIDGSTGMAEQLANVTTQWRVNGEAPRPLQVKSGLVRSTYETTVNVSGKDQRVSGTTYYLSGM